ncbi:hypothetical protein ACLMJK_006045 [Lecanora helva]
MKKRVSSKKSTDKRSASGNGLPIYSAEELASLSHAELVAHAVALQKQLDAKPTATSTKELSPEDVAKKVDRLRSLMERQIRKSMTWKPACKTGGATFSQDFVVQSEEVFKALFKPVVKEGSKSWKMKKFSIDDFEKVVGSEICANARYTDLVLTSDVNVRWDTENVTLRCSGKYGKPFTGKAAYSVEDDEKDDKK